MATINISDLSVGDWVVVRWPDGERWRGRLTRISVTGSVEVRCANGKHVRCSSDFISSIPITAEILEKIGFARGQRGDFYHYIRLDKNRTLYIHASTNGWRVEITYDAAGILRTTHLMSDINSVHGLQHALRLAGVDKEINL